MTVIVAQSRMFNVTEKADLLSVIRGFSNYFNYEQKLAFWLQLHHITLCMQLNVLERQLLFVQTHDGWIN